jgi:DNA-binding HxlR family transcriptional regulator
MATQTAAQQREQARIAYDAFIAACPTRKLLDRLSDKWVCLVLNALAGRTQRYSDLSRIVAGVSQKMLTQTLRVLERDGLIRREVTASVPVRVDYSLTPLGESLRALMAGFKDWAEANFDAVSTARADYDARTPDLTIGPGGAS